MNLANVGVGNTVTINSIEGRGSFRRRLLELGLLPGTKVTVLGVAPLRDPLELLVRGSNLSIRRAEASIVSVQEPRKSQERAATEPSLSIRPDSWAGSPL
jgi:ferrous iron transport protein A